MAGTRLEVGDSGPECIGDPRLRRALAYWASRRPADGRLPGRADIDPLDIPDLLPFVELSDVLDGGADFRFRLVGSHLVDTDGLNPTGMLHSRFFAHPPYRAYQAALYGWVVANGRPLYSRSRIPTDLLGFHVLSERIYMPLAADGRAVDMILNVQVCEGVAGSGLTLEEALDPRHGETAVAAVDPDRA